MIFTLPPGFETYFKEWEEKIGAFVESGVSEKAREAYLPKKDASAPSRVSGLPFAVKDNIALKGASFACGSKMLEGLKAPYTAAAVEKLIEAGCVPLGKTRLDEFGMAAAAAEGGKKKACNPWNTNLSAGGFCEGSAAAVAAGLVPFALASDTGGSLRQSAAACGVAGLKPTFGAVSRYGLAAYGSSLEAIGVIADTVSRCRAVFDIIRGEDPSDQTSVNAPKDAPPLYGSSGGNKAGSRVIGVLSLDALLKAMAPLGGETGAEKKALEIAVRAAETDSEVRASFEAAKANLAALGFTMKEVEIPSLKYAVPAFHSIAAAEASAALARFDGIRFGKRPDWADNPDELVDKARAQGLGDEVKLEILLGTHVLRSGLQERYFIPAQRIRAGIRRNLEALLGSADYSGGRGTYDALLFPVFPARAYVDCSSSLSALERKAADIYTCCANLAGLPALSFPSSLEGGLPSGVQLIGRAFSEGLLLDIAEAYENAHPFPRPQGYKKFWN